MVKAAIVNYGVGNLHSIRRGMQMAGATVEVSGDPRELRQADILVLPGVGAFKSAMKKLDPELIKRSVEEGKLLLGICLGLQLFMEWSEEGGGCDGLELFEGDVVRLPGEVKVPQMGWNTIEIKESHPVFEGIESDSYFYFVHSYYVRPKDSGLVLAETEYGARFPSVVGSDRVIGTQFHPEKSGKIGLRMLRNLVRMVKK